MHVFMEFLTFRKVHSFTGSWYCTRDFHIKLEDMRQQIIVGVLFCFCIMSVLVILVSTPVCQRGSVRKTAMSVEAEVSPGSREKKSTKRTRSRRRSRCIGESNLIKSTISRRCLGFRLAVPRSSHGSLILLFDASESFLTV